MNRVKRRGVVLHALVDDHPWQLTLTRRGRAPWMIFHHEQEQLCLHTFEAPSSPGIMDLFPAQTPAVVRYCPGVDRVMLLGFGPFEGAVSRVEMGLATPHGCTFQYVLLWEYNGQTHFLTLDTQSEQLDYPVGTVMRFLWISPTTARPLQILYLPEDS